MHPLAILVMAAAAAAVQEQDNPSVGGTAAARFWEEALPGTPMPEVIAYLVQKGIDHSPLLEHYPRNLINTQMPVPWSIVWGHLGSSHADKIEVPPGLFFRMSQVRVGGTMMVSFPAAAVVPAILPHDIAENVPFSNLADVLSVFNITSNSAEAAKVNDTLSRCQARDHDGEHKACATSLEDTVQSAVRMMGISSRQPVWAAASKGLPAGGGLPLQSYVMEAIRTLDGHHHVGCHIVPYPYAVYYCHTTGQLTKAYVISLRGVREQGPVIQLAAICHLNTTSWNPAYPAFEILHTRPGGAPVCHFMQYANLVFGEKAANA